MTKIILKGWSFHESNTEAKEMNVHLETEGYVWFEFILKDGQKVQSGLFKEAKVC